VEESVQVRDKTFVVTGGGSGIGRQLVIELLNRGARVAAVDIRAETLDETAVIAAAGELLSTEILDVTDREAVDLLPERVIGAHGTVDALINNAGIIQPFVRLGELPYEDIERVINVNFYGTVHMVKAFLPHLMERPMAHIANISSMGAFLPVPGQTIYGASKAAVKLMTEGLYAELRGTNVGVSVVMPGSIATNIADNSGMEIPIGPEEAAEYGRRLTSAEDAARIIVDGIASDRFHVFVGRDSRLMNLASRIAPRRATHLIQRRMRDLL
jgi:NAD(P)-dependent dehydrogenase (short-subunit alcohol dehydrogenase family)